MGETVSKKKINSAVILFDAFITSFHVLHLDFEAVSEKTSFKKKLKLDRIDTQLTD